MEKPKRWHLFLIFAVLLLTLYNVLPTVFYYSKPLKDPINQERALKVALQVVERVNALEPEAERWLQSFCSNLGIKPSQIVLNPEFPGYVNIAFKTQNEADIFRSYLPKAGVRIPFVPEQLNLGISPADQVLTTVTVKRQLSVHIDPKELPQFFQFAYKNDSEGHLTPVYKEIVEGRLLDLGLAFGGVSPVAQKVDAIIVQRSGQEQVSAVAVLNLAQQILEVKTLFGEQSPLTNRFFASFTQSTVQQKDEVITKLIDRFEVVKNQVQSAKDSLKQEQIKLQKESKFLDADQQQHLKVLEQHFAKLDGSLKILRQYQNIFASGELAFNKDTLMQCMSQEGSKTILNLGNHNPYVSRLVLDVVQEEIFIDFHADIQTILDYHQDGSELENHRKEKIQHFLVSEIARVAQESHEDVQPKDNSFVISLNQLAGSRSILAFDLAAYAEKKTKSIMHFLDTTWSPQHPDFQKNVFPLLDFHNYTQLPIEKQGLGLYLYAPVSNPFQSQEAGFHTGSLYVIAKGLHSILQKYDSYPDSPEGQLFMEDFTKLVTCLEKQGFYGYPAASMYFSAEYQKDFIFELPDYYSDYLKATREDFAVKGTQRYAVLEFTDVEQRITAYNKIRREMHEELLRRRDEYYSAEVSRNPQEKYFVPPLGRSVWWANLKLNTYKYFNGDDGHVLRWGLDLAGGKSVRIGLKDQDGHAVTESADIHESINELYTRVNKMGVSEVSIRQEGNSIVLDFPGAQGLSAEELITGSSMTFHIVNEKFSSPNSPLIASTSAFLQDVWNESVVTNRTTIQDINAIAWKHLGGNDNDNEMIFHSESAKNLYEAGLRIASPENPSLGAFNDTLSSIVMWRGDDIAGRQGAANPLVVVFHNYALEGSSLEGVQTQYDQNQGNALAFRVRSSYGTKSGKEGNPQNDLHTWTSQYAEAKIQGTTKEVYTGGKGWRMAIILNHTLISAPSLNNALRSDGQITGHFTQREVSQLASDLKAGSLSFTPQILSEQNVSPELGNQEKSKGIYASLLGLILVIAAIVYYYRFAGVVASVAVLFNLFIMWGVLQNLGAAMTLPGIAGIILVLAMAVDANVLVFERFREEYALTKRVAAAIQAGYRKAFTAIIDSNLTTIIAALILIQFDSGPIKGFAVVLIIGIVSSMFTALFMTRYFFGWWIRRTKGNKMLNMRSWVHSSSFDFLSKGKIFFIIMSVVLIAGGFVIFKDRHSMFGMDFTGGYGVTVNLEQQADANYKAEVQKALIAHGAGFQDFTIRELNQPNTLQLHLGVSMDQAGKPFDGMTEVVSLPNINSPAYQSNPRLVWLVTSLQEDGLKLSDSSLEQLDSSWSVMSGQLSDTMRTQALVGLAVAIVCILIYLGVRFEFKYAISAIICLVHDVVVTVGILGLLHLIGITVQIDLQVIGAIMALIGYSLNDTIIVFDRVREDARLYKKISFGDLVNQSLNKTLSRTTITSGTTLLVLIALVCLGGDLIFGFSLVMAIGVVIGTISSLFIASPILLYFHSRAEKKKIESNAHGMKLKKA